MSNPTWNWLNILAPWSRLIFPVCSFLTCRRSVKRRWGAFNTDSPRSCLLDKIRRHLCDNTLPFQNCLEFGLTVIPVHKRVKKPQFEILSQNHTSKTFLHIMSFLLIKQKMISVSTFWKSPRLWASSGSNIQRLITLLSVFFRSNIANLYPRSTTKYMRSVSDSQYFEQSTKKYWLALTVRIFFVWKVAQLRSFLQRCLFHPEEASNLYCNGKIKRMIYFKFYKRRTDYPMDIFILKKMYVWSNGRSTCIWNIFAQRITKNGWEFSISCIQCFSLPIRWENLFSRFGKRNNSMIRNYSQYGMSLSLESVCLLWIKKYGR